MEVCVAAFIFQHVPSMQRKELQLVSHYGRKPTLQQTCVLDKSQRVVAFHAWLVEARVAPLLARYAPVIKHGQRTEHKDKGLQLHSGDDDC